MKTLTFLLLSLCIISLFSCSNDDIVTENELKKVALTDTSAAQILLVNLLSDDTKGISWTFNDEKSSSVQTANSSNYQLIEATKSNIIIKQNETEILSNETTFEKGARYTAYVYGSTALPKITILKDDLTPSTNTSNFKACGLNFSDNQSISLQAYYPQYKATIDSYNESKGTSFEPWATATNWFENIENTYSVPVSYGGNIALTLRSIVSETELMKKYTSFDDKETGGKIYYHLESSSPLLIFKNTVSLEPLKVYSIVFYGEKDAYKYLVINHSDAI